MGKVIVAVDPAGIIQPVIETGLKLGKQLNEPIELVAVVPKEIDLAVAGSGLINEEPWTLEVEKIEDELLQIKNENVEQDITVNVILGNPQEEIVKLIKDTDATYIVMGTHGKTGILYTLMGGTTEYVLRHALIPVVVVPLAVTE